MRPGAGACDVEVVTAGCGGELRRSVGADDVAEAAVLADELAGIGRLATEVEAFEGHTVTVAVVTRG